MTKKEMEILGWLLDYPDEASRFGDSQVFEVGPKLSWTSPWSSTVQAILQNCGVTSITRVEKSTRALEPFEYDKMTEEEYPQPLEKFGVLRTNNDYSLEEVELSQLGNMSEEHGFAWDEEDIHNLEEIFSERPPRVIELFDLAQSNSEHCRHHFFRGNLVVNGVPHPHSLFDLVKRPYKITKHAKIAFCDDASAIEGVSGNRPIHSISPEFDEVFQKEDNRTSYIKSPFKQSFQNHKAHPTFTAETHNFPTGICPYSGAMTGVGGRQRDNHSVSRGGDLLAGTAGYCVGNLSRNSSKSNMAHPLKILIEGSNGVSDYGNRVGEPLIQGFMRSWKDWVKPILFSGGVGQIWDTYRTILRKGLPIAKLGGPAYRIGVGGGSASSRTDTREGDENAVQRGDPLMNQKVGRVIQTCMRFMSNPIAAISDQGAGGNANVLKELVSPMGAEINLDKIIKGDETLTPLEVWIAEYQESYAVIVQDPVILAQICEREGVPFCTIGEITNTGRIIVKSQGEIIVDLDLQKTVGNVPRKTYRLKTKKKELVVPFEPPKMRPYESRVDSCVYRVWKTTDGEELMRAPYVEADETIQELWKRVVELPSVGSKRFLTVKVDRSVGGLVAQQQCVGPFYTPLSNVAVTAQEFYNNNSGIATSIGEKPLLSLIDPRRMARMTVAEALTNLVWAKVELDKVNCSGNWMWPDKDTDLVNAVEALSDMLVEVGVTLDGGKDSLSMKADGVKAPGSLVVSCYANCVHGLRDIITPVLTLEADNIYLLTLGTHKARMGGSALAQVCGHVGDECPDVESPRALRELFNYIQSIRDQIVCGHDRSDGGLITCLAEMCIAGNCPMSVDIGPVDDPVSFLFNEEVGIVIGTKEKLDMDKVPFGVTVQRLGQPENVQANRMTVWNYDEVIFNFKINTVRYLWEKTSFELDSKQSNPVTVKQERDTIHTRKNPEYKITFPFYTQSWKKKFTSRPRVAILRSEGTNGHREMAAAFDHACFETWDVHTNDLKKKPDMLRVFRGLVIPGGFSFSDSLGSGKGAAALLKFNDEIKQSLDEFYSREDTFSLGVCNGFQIMTHLDIFGPSTKLLPNISGRFESRCVSVKIWDNGNIFFKGMGGSVLPIICAHAEGRFEGDGLSRIVAEYADDDGEPTDVYPFSPNGGSVAGIVSENGRHLGMMPHPERCFLAWQLPWNPHNWKSSPWMRMFQNIRQWCA